VAKKFNAHVIAMSLVLRKSPSQIDRKNIYDTRNEKEPYSNENEEVFKLVDDNTKYERSQTKRT